MKIWMEEETGVGPERLSQLEKAADLAAAGEGLDPQDLSLSLTLVSPEEIRELNREHRQVDQVTDVLSFPLYEGAEEIREDIKAGIGAEIDGAGEILLGDVIICEEKIRAQAEEFGHTEEREMLYLFTHSVLHLLGHDHMEEEEKGRMREAEEGVMDALGVPRRTDEITDMIED